MPLLVFLFVSTTSRRILAISGTRRRVGVAVFRTPSPSDAATHTRIASRRDNMENTSHAGASHSTQNKQFHRLYPSLPNEDSYTCAPDGSSRRAAAESLPRRHMEDTQPRVGGDVKLKAQVLVLEEQTQELISINEKWAREYHTMVRYYKEKVRDLKASLQRSHSGSEEGASEERERPVTAKWTDGAEGARAEEEARDLRAENSCLARRGRQQREEIRRLNKALEEALRTTPAPELDSETLQDVWKHQAEVYKEDFATERKDREKLKGKHLDLENRFRRLHRELRLLKSQATQTSPSPPQPPPPAAHECVCPNRGKCPNRPR